MHSMQWIEPGEITPITAKLLIRRECVRFIQYGTNTRSSYDVLTYP